MQGVIRDTFGAGFAFETSVSGQKSKERRLAIRTQGDVATWRSGKMYRDTKDWQSRDSESGSAA